MRRAAAEGHHLSVSTIKSTYQATLDHIAETKSGCESEEQREYCTQVAFFVTSAMSLGEDAFYMFGEASARAYASLVKQALSSSYPDVKGAARFLIGAGQSLAALDAARATSPENPTAIKNLELALELDKVKEIIEEDALE